MTATLAKFEALMRRQDTRTNSRGNTIHDMFLPSERYIIDFAKDFSSQGWKQYDTDQDAHYFGVWVNIGKRLTLTYSEGDWTLVVCDDDQHLQAELNDMEQFYGPLPYYAIGYDADGTRTEYFDERPTL
jgi:hypothetical protein